MCFTQKKNPLIVSLTADVSLQDLWSSESKLKLSEATSAWMFEKQAEHSSQGTGMFILLTIYRYIKEKAFANAV